MVVSVDEGHGLPGEATLGLRARRADQRLDDAPIGRLRVSRVHGFVKLVEDERAVGREADPGVVEDHGRALEAPVDTTTPGWKDGSEHLGLRGVVALPQTSSQRPYRPPSARRCARHRSRRERGPGGQRCAPTCDRSD